MNKNIAITTLLVFISVSNVFAAAAFKSGTRPLVDGVYNSTQAVVTSSRQPLFSWEFASNISSFTITVSTDSLFTDSGEMWNHVGTTATANTINLITRVAYAGTALSANTVYYWQVTIYDAGTTDSDGGQFTVTTAAVGLPEAKYDLAIEWNNPFNPSNNEITRFRYTAKDRDRKMKLRVFTLSGELILDWPEQTVLKDAWYTETWNGKNSNNETVARGIYLVNLMDVGDKVGITRKVAVINGNK